MAYLFRKTLDEVLTRVGAEFMLALILKTGILKTLILASDLLDMT